MSTNTKWSPFQIRVILSIFTGSIMTGIRTDAYTLAVERFRRADMVNDDTVTLTEKGRVFITMLLRTPVPVTRGWANPDTDETVEPQSL